MIVDVLQFSRLRLSDYIPGKNLEKVSSFEYMEEQWLGEIIGFTQVLQLQKQPGITKAVLIDFQDINRRTVTELVLEQIGVPLKPGMGLNAINSILKSEPTKINASVKDRTEYEYLDSKNNDFYLSCVINEGLGLIYVSIIIDEGVVANIKSYLG